MLYKESLGIPSFLWKGMHVALKLIPGSYRGSESWDYLFKTFGVVSA